MLLAIKQRIKNNLHANLPVVLAITDCSMTDCILCAHSDGAGAVSAEGAADRHLGGADETRGTADRGGEPGGVAAVPVLAVPDAPASQAHTQN